MQKLTVMNPVAGTAKRIVEKGMYYTQSHGDCRLYIENVCKNHPDTHITVFGGDGTVNETVRGIMDAHAEQHAIISIRPYGTGNDTMKSLPVTEGDEIAKIDLIRFNDTGYGINMLNIGFDSNVVASGKKFKERFPWLSGKASYILGVVKEYFHTFNDHFKVSACTTDGELFEFEGDCMFCAVCNGQWCGGGFHSSPLSDMQDGVLEMLLVKKTNHFRFLTLVGKYRRGEIVDSATGEVVPEARDLVIYKKIKKMHISGIRNICSDGEIEDATFADISVVEGAIQYQTSKEE